MLHQVVSRRHVTDVHHARQCSAPRSRSHRPCKPVSRGTSPLLLGLRGQVVKYTMGSVGRRLRQLGVTTPSPRQGRACPSLWPSLNPVGAARPSRSVVQVATAASRRYDITFAWCLISSHHIFVPDRALEDRGRLRLPNRHLSKCGRASVVGGRGAACRRRGRARRCGGCVSRRP